MAEVKLLPELHVLLLQVQLRAGLLLVLCHLGPSLLELVDYPVHVASLHIKILGFKDPIKLSESCNLL